LPIKTNLKLNLSFYLVIKLIDFCRKTDECEVLSFTQVKQFIVKVIPEISGFIADFYSIVIVNKWKCYALVSLQRTDIYSFR